MSGKDLSDEVIEKGACAVFEKLLITDSKPQKKECKGDAVHPNEPCDIEHEKISRRERSNECWRDLQRRRQSYEQERSSWQKQSTEHWRDSQRRHSYEQERDSRRERSYEQERGNKHRGDSQPERINEYQRDSRQRRSNERNRPTEDEIKERRMRKKEKKSERKRKSEKKEPSVRHQNNILLTSNLYFHRTISYMSLGGIWIDHLGSKEESVISSEMKCLREKRDGKHYHVTVMNHLEIRKITSTLIEENSPKKQKHGLALKKVEDIVNRHFGSADAWEQPVDLGLGRCTSENKKAVSFYRVVAWPFGQEIRKLLKLGFTNFHITCGYTPNDVHEYKGPATLLCLEDGMPCSLQDATLLTSMITYYAHDRLFLEKLQAMCRRHGYNQLLN